MKKFLMLLAAMMVSVAAMAYDFTGKTFRGTSVANNGNKVTVTAKFRANNRLTMSYSGKGYGTNTDSNMYWENVGDYINICDSTGDTNYLVVGTDTDGKVMLQMCDANGHPYVTLKEAAAGQAAGKSSKKTGKKRR